MPESVYRVMGWVALGLMFITLAQIKLNFIKVIKNGKNYHCLFKMSCMTEKDRLNVDIKGLREAIECVAHEEQRTLSNMGRILIMEALAARETKSGQRLPLPQQLEAGDTIHTVVARNLKKLRRAGVGNLKALASGDVLPTKGDFLKIASALELTEEEQHILWERSFTS
jgi:hypothetical protein